MGRRNTVNYRTLGGLLMIGQLLSIQAFAVAGSPVSDLFFEDFSTGASLDNWTIDAPPGGQAVWNGMDGSRDNGSLELALSTPAFIEVTSECFPYDRTRQFTLTLNLKAVQTAPFTCGFEYLTYDSSNCSGPETFRNLVGGDPGPSDTWLEQELFILLDEGPAAVPVQTMRLRLSHEGQPTGSSCLYDEIRVRGTAAIPVIDRVGLGVLVLSLGLAALGILRRR